MPPQKPSDLEQQVLGVLWDNGPSMVRDVLAALPDEKERAYTTVLTILQILEKKGLVRHTRDGLANVYHAKVTREEVVQPLLKGLVKGVFGGEPARVVQALLQSGAVGPDELKQIRKLINEAAREAQSGEKPSGGKSS
jgi:predicted transcriptional regulator